MRLAFLASFVIHSCAIAGGVLLFNMTLPTVLPVGESIEVSLVVLPAPGSGPGGSDSSPGAATPVEPQTDTVPAQLPHNLPTDAQKKPPDRSIIPTQAQSEQTAQAKGRVASGKAPANGQGPANEGAGHGYGESGNGSLPSPLGGQINPRPVYPELARQRGQEGQVVLLVHVDIRGNPTNVSVEASSEHTLLDQAALRAIQRWKFNPASRNGEAVPGTVRVPVTFRLQ